MKKFLKPEYIVVLATMLILSVILLIKPLIGMANSGDFERIMTSASLSYATDDPEEKYFQYFISRFLISGDVWTAVPSYISSQVILVKLSAWISQWFTPGWFDLRFLAFLYMLLLSAAFYFLIRSIPSGYKAVRWTLAAMLVWVFADAGYTAYFNSLFGEPVSMVFLLLVMGFVMAIARVYTSKNQVHSGDNNDISNNDNRIERTLWWLLVGFYLSGLFVVGAKVQNVPLVLILLLISFRLWGFSSTKLWKTTVAAGSVLLVLCSVVTYSAINKDIKVINQYQTVFYGILKTSEAPREDLQELGLNPDWEVLAGYHYFVPDPPINIQAPEFEAELREQISHFKIAMFYLKHPLRFWEILSIAGENAFTIKPSYLGNYEKEEGRPPGALSHAFTSYSKAKVHLLPRSLGLILIFYIAFGLVWVSEYMQSRNRARRLTLEMVLGIAIMGLIQLVVPIIGDGLADIEKHLFLFNVTWDMMVVGMGVWIVHTLVERRKRMKQLLQKA